MEFSWPRSIRWTRTPRCFERDLELMELLDRLGFHEAWIGEHHSAGWETISSPELFIAVAAERTRSIRFGTGVISLPYHNPLMTANRIIQLDHMTRGRVMFGAGPGLLASDALMLGIDPNVQRDRMAEALDVILRLLPRRDRHREDRLVHLRQRAGASAALHEAASRGRGGQRGDAVRRPAGGQIRPQHDLRRCRPIRSASTRSPPTGRSPTTSPRSKAARWTRRGCAWSGRCTSPRRAPRRMRTAVRVRALPRLPQQQPAASSCRRPAPTRPSGSSSNKFGVIGTPDDAIALIERLQAKQGEFGVMLHQAHNWADWEATKRSYELYARYVMPHFSGDNVPRVESFDWCTAHRDELTEKRSAAARAMFDKHEAEWSKRGEQAARPEQGQRVQRRLSGSARVSDMCRPAGARLHRHECPAADGHAPATAAKPDRDNGAATLSERQPRPACGPGTVRRPP